MKKTNQLQNGQKIKKQIPIWLKALLLTMAIIIGILIRSYFETKLK